MQNENTAPPGVCSTRRYDAAPSAGWPGEAGVLQAVDQRLRMFDAHADGKRLEAHGHAGGREPALDVAGRVAGRDDHGGRLDLVAGAQPDPAHLSRRTGEQRVHAATRSRSRPRPSPAARASP
jgi:hypothetical protein